MQSPKGPNGDPDKDKASKKSSKTSQAKNIFDTIRTIDRKALEKVASQANIDLPKPQLVTQWQALPSQKILPFTANEPVVGKISGPTADLDESEKLIQNWICGQCISTYPRINGIRCGDPVADRYTAKLFANRSLFVVTDGCNWGQKPKLASERASQKFMDFMEQHLPGMKDLPDVGHFLLAALAEAHQLVLSAGLKDPEGEPGATTLLGGLVTRMVDGSYACIMVNVGDCKAFHYVAKHNCVIDITDGNRSSVRNARDPGGRIGGYNEGQPDLRNLVLYYQPMMEDDILFIVSDGVHDNLDPQTLGVEPQQLLLDELTWNDVTDARCLLAKSKFRLRLINILMQKHEWNVKNVTTRLLKHSVSVTKKTREWMQQNPTKREPTDQAQFPGKMDHTTCVSIRIGSPLPAAAAAPPSGSSSTASATPAPAATLAAATASTTATASASAAPTLAVTSGSTTPPLLTPTSQSSSPNGSAPTSGRAGSGVASSTVSQESPPKATSK